MLSRPAQGALMPGTSGCESGDGRIPKRRRVVDLSPSHLRNQSVAASVVNWVIVAYGVRYSLPALPGSGRTHRTLPGTFGSTQAQYTHPSFPIGFTECFWLGALVLRLALVNVSCQ